jgi:predicted ATPase
MYEPETTHKLIHLFYALFSIAGKTRLIRQTLSPKVASAGGYLLVGKFDRPILCPEQQHQQPHVGLVAALAQFVRQVLQRGGTGQAAVHQALTEAGVGDDDWQILAGMIPQLKQMLHNEKHEKAATDRSGDNGSSWSFSVQHHQRAPAPGAPTRLAYLLFTFLRAISSSQLIGVPIVLLLDDVHFADQPSWQMLSNIVADLANCPSLRVVVTYDDFHDDDVRRCSAHEAMEKMNKETGCNITRVQVRALGPKDVERFLADALDMKCSPTTQELAALVVDRTNGNAFYIMELIKYLLLANLLRHDSSSTGWRFDGQGMQITLAICRGPSDFLVLQLEGLSTELQQFLKVASCYGSNVVHVHLLQHIFDDATLPLLREATAFGLLKQDSANETYSFAHDIVQQVVYDLIPTSEREQFHLEIGRRMRNAIKAEELEMSVYVLTSQFCLAKRLVTEQTELYDVAGLCLLAGRKAASSSSFRTACLFLNFGIEFLGDHGRQDQYHLFLALYNAAAEMHLCVADFVAMDRLLDVVLTEARQCDYIQAETTRMYALGIRNMSNQSVDLGIALLARLGESLPCRFGTARLLLGAIRVHRQLRGKSDEELLCLPNMEDPEKLACIQILNLLFLHSILTRPKLVPSVALKSMQLTLKYGHCLMSPIAFSIYGVILEQMGQIDEAFRFGQLAIKILERLGRDEPLPRVYANFYGVVYPLKRPYSEALAKLHQGYRVGLQTGDYEFACMNAYGYGSASMMAGVPLPTIDKEYGRMSTIMTALGQETMIAFCKPWFQMIHHLMGLTDDPLGSKGDLLNYETAYQHSLHTNQSVEAMIILTRLVLSCFFNDFAGAYVHATKCLRDVANLSTSRQGKAFACFFISIAYLENTAGHFWMKRKALRIARTTASLLKNLSLNCPANYSHFRMLLEAEVAAAKGHEVPAFELYSHSVACAKSGMSLMMEAFGNERCGRFLYKIKRREEARSFLEEACALYQRWGGMAKVVRLQQDITAMFGTRPV